ncbi:MULTISPECIES: L-threonylcarbamoyladenylate synthase [Acidobacterium]|nr:MULTISPECIES: L-threonylcarbamoyladenylate synthase [Acidobacterium]
MKLTLRLPVDLMAPESANFHASIARAAEILRAGGTVAFPTETVYGLGANALDAAAVAGIFEAKQRPAWDPLIVHVSSLEMLSQVADELCDNAKRLAEVFWPGPLTMLLPRSANVPDAVTAGRPLVGVRMPSHPIAQALIEAAGVPVAAPSANSFGRISPTTAQHVAEDLEGRIDAILDGGETIHGLESTVIEPRADHSIIYRPGVVTAQQLRAVCAGSVEYYEPAHEKSAPESLPSPGVGLRHYAPRARLQLVEGAGEAQMTALRETVLDAERIGERVGVMLPESFQTALIGCAAHVYRWGRWEDKEELAQRLFAGLRQLDAEGLTLIVCPLPEAKGIGRAICDRLGKAARTHD